MRTHCDFHCYYYLNFLPIENNKTQREEGSSRLKHIESNQCGGLTRREYNSLKSMEIAIEPCVFAVKHPA